ncbi:sulfite exporter TauE/SafE family protein [Modestobacter sp. SYSU DS0875]
MIAWLLSGLVVVVATVAQATAGVGFGIVAGPLVLLVRPDLVPGPLLLVGLLVTVSVAWSERAAWEPRVLRGAALASVPGALAGVLLLRAVDDTALALTIGGLVLVTCLVSAVGLQLPSGPRALRWAGLTAGVFSTVAAAPGPPMVVTYRPDRAATQRANLALFFVVTSVVSLALLATGGELTGRAALSGVALLPFVVVGHLLARPVRRRLSLGVVRRLALGLCAASGLLLLVTTLAG